MKYDFIFWDWNGTLLDDAQATCDAVNAMLDKRGLPNITLKQYRDLIEVPIIGFYEKVMDVSEETMESLSVEFHSRWAENLQQSPLAFDAAEILFKLRDMGIRQYIFSSSQNKLIEPFLERYSIDYCFERVLGAPDCYVGSKVERTRAFLQENGIPKNKALFIGDMVHDNEVATAIGSDCILVSHGHQCEEALRATGREVVPTLSALFELLIKDKILL